MEENPTRERNYWTPTKWINEGDYLPILHGPAIHRYNSRKTMTAVIPLNIVLALMMWLGATIRWAGTRIASDARIAYDQGVIHGWRQARREIESHRELVVALDNLTDDKGALPWLPESPQRDHLENVLDGLRFRRYLATTPEERMHGRASTQISLSRIQSWDPPPQTKKWWEEHTTSRNSKSGTPGST